MAQKILWDKFETALLIEACQQIENDEISRKEALQKLSKNLCQRAIDAGLEIDEVYRNENGISNQLGRIQRLMHQIPGADKHTAKIFVDMVNLFYNDRPSFDAILSEAKGGVKIVKTERELFMEWLSSRVSAFNLADYYLAFVEVEKFAKKNKIISESLHRVTDPEITKKIVAALRRSRSFRFSRKKQILYVSVAELFHEYTLKNEEQAASKRNANAQEQVEHISTPEIKDNQLNWNESVFTKSAEIVVSIEKEAVSDFSNELVIDFQNDTDYSFTKPASAIYFGEKIFESPDSWRKLYVCVCQALFDDYPHIFEDLRAEAVSKDEGSLICDSRIAKRLTSPVQISPGYYVETNRSASDLIKKIRTLLDTCQVDYENLEIRYFKSKECENDVSQKLSSTDNEGEEDFEAVASYKNDSAAKNISIEKAEKRRAFMSWMEDYNLSLSTCRSYASAITGVDEFAGRHGLTHKSLYLISSRAELLVTWSVLKQSQIFIEYNRKQHNRFSAAIKLYADFLHSYTPGSAVTEKPMKKETYPVKEYVKTKSAVHPGRIEFEDWLVKNGCPSHSVKSYADGVEHIGRFLLEHRLEDRKIYSIRGVSRLEGIRLNLRQNSDYMKDGQNGAAPLELYGLKKYISFRKNDSYHELDDNVADQFSAILRDNFENGFRPDSIIDRNRFKQYYADRYGAEPTQSDAEIVEALKQVGIMRDGRIFIRDDSASSDLLDDILAEVAFTFKRGATCIYYSEIYERYQEELANQVQVYSQESMKNLLLSDSYGEYCSRKDYLYQSGKEPEVENDIKQVMYQSQVPLTYEDIHLKLWYIPLDTIKRCLSTSSEFVNVAQETYFYALNLPISSEERKDIAKLIHDQLEQKSFLTDVELRDLIEKNYPSIAINTENFTTWGLRNCLSVLLKDQFSFNGTIICQKDQELDMSQVFMDFCCSHDLLTMDELRSFAKDVNNGYIYWDSVREVMIRISQDEFIPKGQMEFDVTATDSVLNDLFEGEYMPLKDFRLFLHYPPVCVKWNKYVLESYAASYSREFTLLHVGYTATDCCGAVVRKDSLIKEFPELILDVLAHSDSWQTKGDALSLLVDEGYLQRKHYAKIDAILPEARLQREKIQAASLR